MNDTNIWGRAPDWISRSRNWMSERARLRRDADQIAQMDSRELLDLGFSHTAALEVGMTMTEFGPVAHRNWLNAEPCFPRRPIRRNQNRA